MNSVDSGNPYQAPKASIAALRAEIRRPPVYTAISLFCWAVGAFHFAGCLFMIWLVIRNGLERRWVGAFGPGNDLIGPLILGLGLLSAFSYVFAGQWLRDNRGRPGLILCITGMGLTFLIIWLSGWS